MKADLIAVLMDKEGVTAKEPHEVVNPGNTQGERSIQSVKVYIPLDKWPHKKGRVTSALPLLDP